MNPPNQSALENAARGYVEARRALQAIPALQSHADARLHLDETWAVLLRECGYQTRWDDRNVRTVVEPIPSSTAELF